MIFNRDKVKIKVEKTKDGDKYYLDYSRIKEKEEFKRYVFNKIFSENTVLAVIDTKLIYKESIHENTKVELENFFEKNSIETKMEKTKKENETGIFGTLVKINNKNKAYDYIFGFLATIENYSLLKYIINKYNTSFFMFENKGESELLGLFNEEYEEMDFKISLYDDNFLNNILIYDRSKGKSIMKIIQDLVAEYK